MLARELAAEYPTIRGDTNALEAARLLESQRLPGLVVVADDGKPLTVLPAYHVARFVVPVYIREDPALARVVDEAHADHLFDFLASKRVNDLLVADRSESLVVQADETMIEIAELMERERSPLVAVVDEHGLLLGAVTLFELLGAALPVS